MVDVTTGKLTSSPPKSIPNRSPRLAVWRRLHANPLAPGVVEPVECVVQTGRVGLRVRSQTTRRLLG